MLTTDRRILFFFTYLSGRRTQFRAADRGRVDDGQTNSVLFHLSVLPSSAVPSRPSPSHQSRSPHLSLSLSNNRVAATANLTISTIYLYDLPTSPSIFNHRTICVLAPHRRSSSYCHEFPRCIDDANNNYFSSAIIVVVSISTSRCKFHNNAESEKGSRG